MRTRKLAPFVALAVTVAACSSGGSDTAPAQVSPVSTDEVVTTEGPEAQASTSDEAPTTPPGDVDSEIEVTIEASPHISLAAAVTVSSNEPMFVQINASGPDHEVEVPRTAEMATEHVIPLVGMRAESTYLISVTLSDGGDEASVLSDVGEFTTGALPEYFADHELTIDAERASPGFTIIEFDSIAVPEGASSSQHLVAYDNEGEIVWYYTNTGALAGVERTPAGTFNMFYWPFGIREVDILGNVLNNWRPQQLGADELDDEFIVGAPDPDQVAFVGGAGALIGNPGDAAPVAIVNDWIDLVTIHHENWPMPNGNVLTLSTTTHELTPEQRSTFCPDDPNEFNAVSDVAVEFTPDGQVVRTWDLWDAIDINEFPGSQMCVTAGIFAGEDTRDWNHANSVVYDPDRDAVIISSRHTNQIVAFDHLDEEGPQSSVRWILGAGSTMPLDGEPTTFQHAVEVNSDGSLIVYDNGNERVGTSADDPDNPKYSRAVIYDVDDSSDDPAEWAASQRWENIDTEADGTLAFSSFISDADMLPNGNVLVTHGGIGSIIPDPDNPLHILIREVIPDGTSGGEVVWELKGALGFATYRAERIESFYFGPQFAS